MTDQKEKDPYEDLWELAEDYIQTPESRIDHHRFTAAVRKKFDIRFKSDGGWISVDTPPRTGGRYLCYTKGDGVKILYYQDNEGFWVKDGNYYSPTHWQPLPQKPEGV